MHLVVGCTLFWSTHEKIVPIPEERRDIFGNNELGLD